MSMVTVNTNACGVGVGVGVGVGSGAGGNPVATVVVGWVAVCWPVASKAKNETGTLAVSGFWTLKIMEIGWFANTTDRTAIVVWSRDTEDGNSNAVTERRR
jgi:hypothetical protein